MLNILYKNSKKNKIESANVTFISTFRGEICGRHYFATAHLREPGLGKITEAIYLK